MSDLSLLATVLAKGLSRQTDTHAAPPPTTQSIAADWKAPRSPQKNAILLPDVRPDVDHQTTEFSQPTTIAPQSGSQFYWQRAAALQAGRLYTRLPLDSFRNIWSQATGNPTYGQWRRLLTLEAKAATRGQGHRRLSIIVGDSLSLWFPSDRLPTGQLWLNQSISGETTGNILHRLSDFAIARPHTIYVMAGVNDLKHGMTDNEILWNLRQIVRRLKQAHPQTRIVVQSILPTRTTAVPGNRIAWLNQRLAAIVQQDGATFLDLYTQFTDANGNLRDDLTTDGLHLNANGYETWQAKLAQAETAIARGG